MISAFTEQLIWFVIVVPLLLPMIKSQQKFFGTRQIFCMVFLIFFFCLQFLHCYTLLINQWKKWMRKTLFSLIHIQLAFQSVPFKFGFSNKPFVSFFDSTSVSFLFSQFNSIHIKGKELNYYKYHRRRFWHRFVRQGLNLTFIF